jgi:hypothetical protein
MSNKKVILKRCASCKEIFKPKSWASHESVCEKCKRKSSER